MKANEEKANEICGGNWRVFNKEYAAALEMAEWKDSQIREIIDEEIGRANLYHDKQLSRTQISASVTTISEKSSQKISFTLVLQ